MDLKKQKQCKLFLKSILIFYITLCHQCIHPKKKKKKKNTLNKLQSFIPDQIEKLLIVIIIHPYLVTL